MEFVDFRRNMSDGFITILFQLLKMSFQFFTIVVMARLIEIDDIGSFVIAALIVSFAEVCRDFGLRLNTTQRLHLSERENSNYFWLSTSLGFLFFTIIFSGTYLIELFTGANLVLLLARWMCFSIIFSGIMSQINTQMFRSGKFLSMGVTDAISQLIAGSFGVWMAFAGFGVWSLVVQYLAATASLLMMRAFYLRWLPMKPVRIENLWRVFRGTKNIGLTNLFNWIGNNIDTLVLSIYFPPQIVGLYSRGFSLLVTPQLNLLESFGNWFMPSMKGVNKDVRGDLHLSRVQQTLIGIFLPVNLLVICFSAEIVRFLLGEKWISLSAILTALSIASLPSIFIHIYRWLFIIYEETLLLVRLTAISRVIMVLSLIVASYFSFDAVLVSIIVSNFFSWILMYSFFARIHQRKSIFLSQLLAVSLFALTYFFWKNVFSLSLSNQPIFIIALVPLVIFLLFWLFAKELIRSSHVKTVISKCMRNMTK